MLWPALASWLGSKIFQNLGVGSLFSVRSTNTSLVSQQARETGKSVSKSLAAEEARGLPRSAFASDRLWRRLMKILGGGGIRQTRYTFCTPCSLLGRISRMSVSSAGLIEELFIDFFTPESAHAAWNSAASSAIARVRRHGRTKVHMKNLLLATRHFQKKHHRWWHHRVFGGCWSF